MSDTKALTGMLNGMEQDTSGAEVQMGQLVEALNSRGFGPLLLGPSLITILPTGAIPGIPAMCALIVIFVSIQLLMGKSHPWLPKRLKDFSFSRKKFVAALNKAQPYTKKIDTYIYPRLTFLIRPELQPLIAVLCIALSIAIIILGFIPFLAILPASGILLIGLGLTARDGLLFALSFLVCIGSLAALPYGFSALFG